MYEIALVRVLTWTAVGIFLVCSFALGISQFRTAKRNYEFTQQLGGTGEECEAVDDALEEWPMEHGEAPQRLSVAMALFATGDLDKSCLRAEVNNPLTVMESRSLAYLAKSFIYSDSQEMSDKYLNEVCDTDRKSDECRLAQVIEGMANEDAAMVNAQFEGLTPDSRIYLSLWAIRQYMRMQDFLSAARFIDHLPNHSSLAYFSIPSRAKIYWGTHRFEESRASAAAALDLLTGDDKLQFASWFCFAELTHSCSAKASGACKTFSRLSEKIDEALSDFQPALTRVKAGECDPELQATGLMVAGMHPEVRQYAELLEDKDLSELHAYWQDSETRFELKDEAARQIVQMTRERKYIDPIRSEWMARSRGLAWEQLGRALFTNDFESKNWVAALEVGDRLMKFASASQPPANASVRAPASSAATKTKSFEEKLSEVRRQVSAGAK